MLDWDAFRIILAVAKEGSLSAAARKLEINHATVSRQLKRAETVLGTKIFDRMNNGLFPTEEGRTVIDSAIEIGRKVDEVSHSLLGRDRSLSGPIRVSLPHNLLAYGLGQYIADFRELYPEITFQIITTDGITSFADREVDVAIRADNSPPSGLWGFKLSAVSYSFVASEGYLKRWTPHMQASSETAPLPFIALSTSDPKADEMQFLNKFPMAQKVINCNGLDGAIPLVQTGVGAARVARFMLPNFPALRTILECSNEWDRLLWILTHPDFRSTPRIRLFMEYVRDRFNEKDPN